MEDIINIMLNTGASLGCLIYFMWTTSTIIKENTKIIQELKESIVKLNEKIDKLEDYVSFLEDVIGVKKEDK